MRHRPGATSRRGVLAALGAGMLAAALPTGRVLARQDTDCALGCTESVCGETPAECAIFPFDHIWNTPVVDLPVAARSDAYIASIGADTGVHPDFGAGLYEGMPLGIPFVRVPADQPPVDVVFTEAPDESDPGPYPVPADAPIEGSSCGDGDRHVLVAQEGSCLLYELYAAYPQPDGSWQAGSGAVFDLTGYHLRPAGWTSADAAGLPILPGLVRYEEIAAGVINHALRFTAAKTQNAYVWPARHEASDDANPDLPPLGQRFRLKADVDVSNFSPTNQIILAALQTYGMMLADNGSDWFLSGAPDDRWDNDDLHELQERISGGDFEAVDVSSLMRDPDSGQVA